MWLQLGLLVVAVCIQVSVADQRQKAEVTPGIVECKPARRRRWQNWGTSLLKEARLYESDGKTELKLGEVDGEKVFKFRIGSNYKIKASFSVVRYPEGFGALPKYMGLKLTEEYTRADFGTQQIYESTYGKPMIGRQECSPVLFGARGKDANACKWLTKETKGMCPLNEKPDEIVEIEFPFIVPNFPNAFTNTSFRLIPTETPVRRGGCQLIGQPGGTETTIDKDMICFQYPTAINKIFKN